MTRHQYRDAKTKSAAVAEAEVRGIRAVSRDRGIPEATLRGWYHSEEFAQLRARTKQEVTDEWWAIVQKGMRRVEQLLDSSGDVQKAATATAIVADKMLLLRGEATSRSESRTLGDLDDHERATIKRLAVERLAGLEVGSSPAGAGLDAPAASDGTPAAVEPVAADGGTGQRQD